MSFKPNDLVLCVDARPLPHNLIVGIGVREGVVYTVRQVVVCCTVRLELVELRYHDLFRCECAAVQPGSYFAWRFVKVGDAMSQSDELRAARRAVDEATRVPARLLVPTRERETT